MNYIYLPIGSILEASRNNINYYIKIFILTL